LSVFVPPLNNFATNGLEKGNFTATVRTKIYPEEGSCPFNNPNNGIKQLKKEGRKG